MNRHTRRIILSLAAVVLAGLAMAAPRPATAQYAFTTIDFPGAAGTEILGFSTRTMVGDFVDAEMTIDGAAADQIALAWLSHTDMLAHNTFDQPNTLVPQRETLPALPAGPWRHTFPPASVSVFTVRLAGYQDDGSRADGARN